MITLGMAGEVLTGAGLGVEQAVRRVKSKRKKEERLCIWNFENDRHDAVTESLLNRLLELLEGGHPGNRVDEISQ